ncbi:MAG: T9SS type A sorting domain-containing protein [Bacteroidetes bacterium]|nr:T9SS type A sorting domain-containing protein [Bacteroidota bacterium]
MKATFLPIISAIVLLTVGLSSSAQSPIIIKDINPGSLDGVVNQTYLRVGDKIYFWGNDGVTDNELWVTDGTAAGTTLVSEIIPGPNGALVIDMLGTYQGKLVFMADDSIHGREPWISDGTPAGTFMLADVNPGTGHSIPAYPRECLGKLYFQADDGTHGQEPWVSDGTVAGTRLLEDVQPGFGSSGPRYFTEYNGAVYFQTYTTSYGYEPWVTTGSGATLYQDLQPGFSDGGFYTPCVYNGKLYFGGYSTANGLELWVTDGQPANTALFADINPGTGSGFTDGAIDTMGGRLFFNGSDGTHGFELWATDGTVAGTAMVHDIEPSGSGSFPTHFMRLGNKLICIAGEGIDIRNLWATDLTTLATEKVSRFDPTYNNVVRYPTIWRDSIYYFDYGTYDGSQYLYDLYVTAGDSASVRRINRLTLQNSINTNSWLDATTHGIVYRARYDVGTGYELYTLDIPSGPNSIVATSDKDELHLYPNPAYGTLSLTSDRPFVEASVSISDLLGREVVTYSALTGDRLQIDVSAIPAGAYTLHITDGAHESVRRFCKE